MKRFLAGLLCLCILLAGCTASTPKPGVSFYYPRKQYLYHDSQNVIVPETREISGSSSDLQYLITLYLVGPKDDKLESPFPRETRLESLTRVEKSLFLTLSSPDHNLSDAMFSLASACLARTCFSASPEVEEVCVTLDNHTLVITRDNLILTDDLTGSAEATEESK